MDRYRVPETLAWPDEIGRALDPALYRDRCVGSLLAGALGDGLGSAAEGMSRDQILAQYGPAGLTDLPAWGARWTDDTQLTAIIGESLVATGAGLTPPTSSAA